MKNSLQAQMDKITKSNQFFIFSLISLKFVHNALILNFFGLNWEKMKQSLIRKGIRNSKNIFSQSKQQVILKCKHCSSTTVKVITPNGTILYYCCNESCNFSGKIISLFIKQKTEKTNSSIIKRNKILSKIFAKSLWDLIWFI